MNPFVKYLQDTRAEMRHVAWPTQTQTIVYTVMVVVLSVGVSLYLGLFDFIFTSSLSRALMALPHAAPVETSQPLQQLSPEQLQQLQQQAAEQKAPTAPAQAPAGTFGIPTN